MDKHTGKQIKSKLLDAKHILIVAHKNPDGDAIGSSLALYHFLKILKCKVSVVMPNDYPSFLKWLPGNEAVLIYENQTDVCDEMINSADVIFTLDFNAFHRTGFMEESLANSEALKIMIDHHLSPEDYATYTYSDSSMSSTCEMVYHFIEALGDLDNINKDIATCLYLGIMTDTGSFKFPLTTHITHAIIAKLIEKGVDKTEIHNAVYDNNTFSRLQLLGCALSNLKMIQSYKTAYITLSQEELNTYQFKKGDTEGFVNYALSLKGIVLAAIFIENKKEDIIKISFRSKGNFSVNALSQSHFNGGGHANAAGGKSDLSLDDTVKKFVDILPQYNTLLA